MQELSQELSDLFGLIYKNLIREEDDPVVLSTNARNAVLSVIYRKGPLPMNEIGEHLRVTKSNMTFLVDKLEKAGLIERRRSSEDRRKINIILTEEGLRSIKDEHAHRIEKIGSYLEGLEIADVEELHTAVRTIKRILRKL